MKNKAAIVIPEKIHLFSVNIFKARMDTTDIFLETPQKADAYDFGMSNEMGHDLENKNVRCRILLTLKARNVDESLLGLELEYGIEFHFRIDNFSDFYILEKSGGFKMDSNLAATLLGMAYSTARGVVYERTRGTFFDGILLPVIDPYKALDDKQGVNKKSKG